MAGQRLATLKLQRHQMASSSLPRRRHIPSILVKVRVFNGRRPALARNKPGLAGKWTVEKERQSFEWSTKRDRRNIRLTANDRLETAPIMGSYEEESEGYEPIDFDRLVEIAGDDGEFETIDQSTLMEAQPDFMPWLPHE